MGKIKGAIIGFIAGGLLFSASLVFAQTQYNILPNPFPVMINGAAGEVEGLNINGYTYLKLADLKATGLVVKFNETERQIEITTNLLDVVEIK